MANYQVTFWKHIPSQVKAWDETFSQTVHQRFSYHYGEIVWNARFTPAFAVNEEGDMVLDVDRVGSYAEISAPRA